MPRREDVEDGCECAAGAWRWWPGSPLEWGVRQEAGGGKVVWCLLTLDG